MVCDRNNPFLARLKARSRVTAPGSDKNVQHLIFDTSGGDVHYGCGDSVAIMPKNNAAAVSDILGFLGISPDAMVNVGNAAMVSIFSALVENFCVTHLPQKFFEWFSSVAADVGGEQLEKLKTCSLVEILAKHRPKLPIGADELLPNLRKLTPRMYSIASSPLAYPDEIHIVVNVVSHADEFGNIVPGVASSYLANGMRVGIDAASIFVVKSMFALPTDASTRLIMIGPGTGIAPFRGFLQERQHLRNNGTKTGDSWLFFGDRHAATDFLFRDEILGFKDLGVLTKLDLAFSRDQEDKVYVQDRILENREELWEWITEGAYVYVCGNASRMAVDVDNALRRVAMDVGGMDAERADDFFKTLKRDRRYRRDVY
ncbi:MAG: hypothetical protein LBT64_03660 [Puniceicoccales bacterium]|jgi:sulfite reductase (NADPH) flavoprotein alpha-component|nr:hypothetical protein [Puniceicoccales bacterium]